MSAAAILATAASLLSKLPPGVLGHVVDFIQAVFDGDEEKAKRAATSAATARIFNAPVTSTEKGE